LALIEVSDIYDLEESVDRAISFLLDDFEREENKFVDISVVGTGHRGLIYLNYPSYPYSFPLIALSRYYQKTYDQTI
jgi:squalene-hopene/tetraprenyl-beta-curcumene cyclase